MISVEKGCTVTILWPQERGVQKNYRLNNLTYGECLAIHQALEKYHGIDLGLEIETTLLDKVKEL